MPPSATDPARVLVDVGLAHLDRPFDYAVPPEWDEAAQPGVRVRVRFAGRRRSGYVLERVSPSAARADLAPIERVVSPEPVLAPEVAELARRVADHYAGTRADVLRLAIPPRHARTEAATPRPRPEGDLAAPASSGWTRYPAGASFVASLADGSTPRAVASMRPGENWPDLLAVVAAAAASSGRGAVLVVPDTKDVARVDAALTARLGPDRHVLLHAEQGPSARYRRFLAVRRGQVPIVLGTRSAVYAPVHRLGLVVVWDDGDDLLAEPRAPYPHARDVALLRAHQQGCGLLLAGFARTAEAHRLVRTGWAGELRADREHVRRAAPALAAATDERSGLHGRRLPEEVFGVVRRALPHGPVLVQVPRGGYRPVVACLGCRAVARCPACLGPLAQGAESAPLACQRCGRSDEAWRCPTCGREEWRAVTVGEGRTALELGRAFPGTPVRRSGLGHVLTEVADEPALVVATPGAEPVATGGYAAAVLLDGDAMIARADLRAGEEALRRWLNALAGVRPADAGGSAVVVAEPGHRAVQALLRWDPAGFADRELDERDETRLPPAWRLAELTGPAAAVADLLARTELPAGSDVLGPFPTAPPSSPLPEGGSTDAVRALVRCPLVQGRALSVALRGAAGVRSARREPGSVRIRIDPADLH